MKKLFFVFALVALTFTACVKDEVYNGPATISDVAYAPEAVTPSDAVTVTAKITCLLDFTATLKYTVNDAEAVPVEMIGSEAEKDIYTATIPVQADQAVVVFWIETVNSDNNASKTEDYTYTVGAVVIDYSGLRLNELNGNDKFIEIYNAGNTEVPMEGVYIEKDAEQNWVCDARTLAPGEYLLLYSEDVTIAGGAQVNYPEELIFHSGLSAKKEVRVQLFNPSGLSLSDFNLVSYNGTPAPASYSLNDDLQWYHAEATPGTINVQGTELVEGLEGNEPPTPDYTNLKLNELNGGTKFIELYNTGNLPLSLEGVYMVKDDEVEIPTWTADATITIPAGGYVLLYSEDVVVTGEAQEGYPAELVFHSGLSAKKSLKIALYLADGTELDVFTRGPEPWGTGISNLDESSMARTPDGGEWKLVAEATPGSANPAEGEDIPQE